MTYQYAYYTSCYNHYNLMPVEGGKHEVYKKSLNVVEPEEPLVCHFFCPVMAQEFYEFLIETELNLLKDSRARLVCIEKYKKAGMLL